MAPPGSSAPAQTETYRRRHLSGSISSMPPQGPCLAGLPFWPTQPFRALLPDSFRPGAHAGPKFGRIHYLASRPIVRGPTSVSPSKAPTVEPRSNITGRCICNETGVNFFRPAKRRGRFESSGASSGGIGRLTRRPLVFSPPTIRSTFIVLSGSNFENIRSTVSLIYHVMF